MRLSARNIIKGTILEVTRGATTAHVRIDVGGGTVITSSITNEAVDALALMVGDAALRGHQSFRRHGGQGLRGSHAHSAGAGRPGSRAPDSLSSPPRRPRWPERTRRMKGIRRSTEV
jgi:molybdopterin-binding protein